MGAITSNRKRDSFLFSDSPDFHHVPKKLRFSLMRQTSYKTPSSSNSTVSRISRYPESTAKFRREVHAPCRKLKFGLSRPRTSDHSDAERSSGDDMGHFLSKKLDFAKRKAIDAFRYLVKEKEVVDVDYEAPKPGKEVLTEDSSIEEIEVMEESGRKGRFRPVDGVDNDVKGAEERSVVTMNGNMEVENDRNFTGLSVSDREVEVSIVGVYKKLLESVRRSTRLLYLAFEIKLNEERWSLLKLLRPVKKPDEKLVEEIPHEPFTALTKEEEEEVKHALSAGNRRRLLVTHDNSNIDITGEILQCLAPCTWLNDEVINVYLELLKEREKREPNKFLKCHFFNTFFYKKLTCGGRPTTIKLSKDGLRKGNWDTFWLTVTKEIHWCLAIINNKDRKFQYLDSMKGTDSRVLEHLCSIVLSDNFDEREFQCKRCEHINSTQRVEEKAKLSKLARYYVEEVKDKSQENIDVSSWEREFLEDLPEQENWHDCGMFMIKYADFYSRGLGLCFGQEHMPYFRQRTAKEILRLRAD